MRLILTLLLTAMLVLGVWSFCAYEPFLLGPGPDGYTWWWPQEISTFGQDIDGLFALISWMILFFFVLTEGVLVYAVWRFGKKSSEKGTFSHGNHKLEMLWTAIPAGLLLLIAFSQMSAWASIKFAGATEGEPIFAEVIASQFDWRFRYPGADGVFGTVDDIENPFEFVVPDDQKIVFNLRSRDVLHSFFVPKLRVKQDAVPGMTIPVWFEFDKEQLAEETDHSFDLICAELCGWGHYKMAGRITVVSREEFDTWMAMKTEDKWSNGQED